MGIDIPVTFNHRCAVCKGYINAICGACNNDDETTCLSCFNPAGYLRVDVSTTATSTAAASPIRKLKSTSLPEPAAKSSAAAKTHASPVTKRKHGSVPKVARAATVLDRYKLAQQCTSSGVQTTMTPYKAS